MDGQTGMCRVNIYQTHSDGLDVTITASNAFPWQEYLGADEEEGDAAAKGAQSAKKSHAAAQPKHSLAAQAAANGKPHAFECVNVPVFPST